MAAAVGADVVGGEGGDDVPDRERPVHTGSGPHRPSVTVLRRSKLVVVDELGRVAGIVVIVIEGVRTDVEHLLVLLRLIQLRDDRPPHRFRDNSTHRLTGLVQRYLQLEDFGVPLTPVEDGLQLLGGAQAGLHTDLGAIVYQGAERFVHRDLEEGHRQRWTSQREIMAELVNRAAGVIQRYGGTVGSFTGDGVMAVFGAPTALEDHAIRACLAALGVQEEATRLAVEVNDRDGVGLQLRVGLNSGQVIAGEMGSGPFGYTAIGEQVGMAQRMESVAPPRRGDAERIDRATR
jgi:hypothetical protein